METRLWLVRFALLLLLIATLQLQRQRRRDDVVLWLDGQAAA